MKLAAAIETAKAEAAAYLTPENPALSVNYEFQTEDFGFCTFTIDRSGRLVKKPE